MEIISIVNQKGGVGKTTIVTNLSYALSQAKSKKKRVLVIDCDQQGNVSSTLKKPSWPTQRTLEDVFMSNSSLSSCISETKFPGVGLISNNLDSAARVTLGLELNSLKRFIGLRAAIERDPKVKEDWDIILIDCPPAIDSLFVTNALTASTHYIIPIEAESLYALEGVQGLLSAIAASSDPVKELVPSYNLTFLGAVITKFDARTTASKTIAEAVIGKFGPEGTFETRIRNNTAIAQANILGMAICQHEPKSNGCIDFRNFSREVLFRISGRIPNA